MTKERNVSSIRGKLVQGFRYQHFSIQAFLSIFLCYPLYAYMCNVFHRADSQQYNRRHLLIRSVEFTQVIGSFEESKKNAIDGNQGHVIG